MFEDMPPNPIHYRQVLACKAAAKGHKSFDADVVDAVHDIVELHDNFMAALEKIKKLNEEIDSLYWELRETENEAKSW